MSLIGGLIGFVTSAFTGWQERQKVKLETDLAIQKAQAEAEIVRIQKVADAEVNWDFEALRQGERSWKDEYWTFVLSIPLILVFIPGMDQYIMRGFQQLEAVPEWYRYSVGIAIAAAFGFRQLVNLFGKKK